MSTLYTVVDKSISQYFENEESDSTSDISTENIRGFRSYRKRNIRSHKKPLNISNFTRNSTEGVMNLIDDLNTPFSSEPRAPRGWIVNSDDAKDRLGALNFSLKSWYAQESQRLSSVTEEQNETKALQSTTDILQEEPQEFMDFRTETRESHLEFDTDASSDCLAYQPKKSSTKSKHVRVCCKTITKNIVSNAFEESTDCNSDETPNILKSSKSPRISLLTVHTTFKEENPFESAKDLLHYSAEISDEFTLPSIKVSVPKKSRNMNGKVSMHTKMRSTQLSCVSQLNVADADNKVRNIEQMIFAKFQLIADLQNELLSLDSENKELHAKLAEVTLTKLFEDKSEE